jgi:hypothetical protein
MHKILDTLCRSLADAAPRVYSAANSPSEAAHTTIALCQPSQRREKDIEESTFERLNIM